MPDQTKNVGRLIDQKKYRKLERVRWADIVSFDLHLQDPSFTEISDDQIVCGPVDQKHP